MKLDIPGYRPALIDEELFRLLNDFRGFRHKFRHIYGFDLDWEKERLVARKFLGTSHLFCRKVKDFLQNLEQIGDEDSQ